MADLLLISVLLASMAVEGLALAWVLPARPAADTRDLTRATRLGLGALNLMLFGWALHIAVFSTHVFSVRLMGCELPLLSQTFWFGLNNHTPLILGFTAFGLLSWPWLHIAALRKLNPRDGVGLLFAALSFGVASSLFIGLSWLTIPAYSLLRVSL